MWFKMSSYSTRLEKNGMCFQMIDLESFELHWMWVTIRSDFVLILHRSCDIRSFTTHWAFCFLWPKRVRKRFRINLSNYFLNMTFENDFGIFWNGLCFLFSFKRHPKFFRIFFPKTTNTLWCKGCIVGQFSKLSNFGSHFKSLRSHFKHLV